MDGPDENIRSAMENNVNNNKSVSLRAQIENMLQNAIIMTEMGMDMKERCSAGEKYVCYLRSLSIKAGKTINSLQSVGKSFLSLAQKLITSMMATIDSISLIDPSCYNMKIEYEKLLSIIEKELVDMEDLDNTHNNLMIPNNLINVSERIKYLETKQKLSTDSSNLQQSGSVKSVKSDIDEKYPENWSRDSLIDLDNVVNLPPVPEDIFTTFANKPSRTSSLSSLKGIRKVKLFLQRAANNTSDEEDDSSELDEHECPPRIVSNYGRF